MKEKMAVGKKPTGRVQAIAPPRCSFLRRKVARSVLPSVTLGLWLTAVFGWLIPQHGALPLAAFACAAAGRLLQRAEIPFVWFAGTALPLLVAWALFGQLIPGWRFPWLVWLGLTVSCKALREIVWVFERVFVEEVIA